LLEDAGIQLVNRRSHVTPISGGVSEFLKNTATYRYYFKSTRLNRPLTLLECTMKRSANISDVTLDDRLCVALYTASRAMTARYRPILAELSLTYPQYLVMVALWENAPLTISEVGDRLNLESSTLSPLVKRLESMGLLKRRRNPNDERSVTLELTKQGDAMRLRADDVPHQISAAVGLSEAKQRELVGQLRKLANELEISYND